MQRELAAREASEGPEVPPAVRTAVDRAISALPVIDIATVDRIAPENDAVYLAIAADSASVYLGGQDFDGQASLIRLLSGA